MESETGHDETGIVFATTGETYTTLARRAARTLRQVMPSAQVDLFTNLEITDPVFDRIHRLHEDFFRPKIHALRASRFARTLYLDADILMVAPIGDVFEILTRYDLVAAHGRYMNNDRMRQAPETTLPAAFSQINSGVLGVRRSPETETFLDLWKTTVRDTEAQYDQPALRDLLWKADLRPYILPPQYNLNGYHEIGRWDPRYAVPRVIHAPSLHRNYADHSPETPLELSEVMGPAQRARLRVLGSADHRLEAHPAPRLSSSRPRRLAQRLLARFA